MMDDIKEIVTHVLDQRGILARMKAELRANVFLAIDDQEKHNNSGIYAKTLSRNRRMLKESKEGRLLADLVREFLDWCDLQFTVKVYDPEMQCSAASAERDHLSAQLGMQEQTGDQPLLLAILQSFMAAGTGQQTAAGAPGPAALAGVAAERSSVPAAADAAAAAAAPGAAAASSQLLSYLSAAKKAGPQPHALDAADSNELIGVEVHGEQEESEDEEDNFSSFARQPAPAKGVHAAAGAESDGSSSASPPAARRQLGHAIAQESQHMQGAPAAAWSSDGDRIGVSTPPYGQSSSPTGAAGDSNSTTPRSELSPSVSPSSAAAQALKPVGKLEPLAPLRGAKLGPLPALKLGAVSPSVKEDPLLPRAGPLSPSGRASMKSSEELKEELRRAGLIHDAAPSPTATQPAHANAAEPSTVKSAAGRLPVAGPAAAGAQGAEAKGVVPRSSALDTDSDSDSDISTESFPEEDLELELPMEGQHTEQQPLAAGHSNVFGDEEAAPRSLSQARASVSLDFHESGWAASDRSGVFDHLHLISAGGADTYMAHADEETESESSDDDF